jgi:hypothetical protein
LLGVTDVFTFRSTCDLVALLPGGLPKQFHTGHLAESLAIRRWIAQRIAYCLRKMAAVRECGKAGNAILYEQVAPPPKAKVRRRKKLG